jgi:multicomponent Na+:H+ antiporter subunit D
MATEALVLLVFWPLLAACAALLAPRRGAPVAVVSTMLALPALLVPVTGEVLRAGTLIHVLGGYAVPLGIRLVADGLGVAVLWLVAVVSGFAGLHALVGFPPSSPLGGRFWPPWLVLLAGMNALLLSADLFNLYVTLELVTLAAISLIALAGGEALRAAMRYLLLAVLASLAYLLGISLLYSVHGTLDLYLIGAALGGGAAPLVAFGLVSAGLLLKTAVFPLHVWLPAAHASAPGPVSALLSALVVKVSLVLLYRLWFFTGAELDAAGAGLLLGVLGAGAVLYGSVAAFLQSRLKLVVAYSTVAQLGYLMLVFPLAGALAWKGALYQLLSHGLAKAAMFLAAANLLAVFGTDRLDRLAGADRRAPVSLFAFALGGVSIMGLPPSGGFLAKWMLLEAAFAQRGWGWIVVLVAGSLLAAAYVFRVLAAIFSEAHAERAAEARAPARSLMGLAALALAILAIVAGFAAAPLLALIEVGSPFASGPA